MLLVFLMAAVVALMLYKAMPRVAFETERDKEQLLIDRGGQYKRAIQLYYTQFRRYPARIEDLENTNDKRFLRRRYVDPFTGKDEWRLVHTNGMALTDSKVQAPPAAGANGQGANGQATTAGAFGAPVGSTSPGSTTSPGASPFGSSTTSSTGNTNTSNGQAAPPQVNGTVFARPSDRTLPASQSFPGNNNGALPPLTYTGNNPGANNGANYNNNDPASFPPLTLYPNGYNAPAQGGATQQPGFNPLNQAGGNQPVFNQAGNQPGLSQPGLNQNGLNQNSYQNGLNPNGLNPNGFNQPNTGLNQPGFNQPGLNQPGVNPTGFNQPSLGQPAINTLLQQPGIIQPGSIQPATNQPVINPGFLPGQNQPGALPPITLGGSQPGQGLPNGGQQPFPVNIQPVDPGQPFQPGINSLPGNQQQNNFAQNPANFNPNLGATPGLPGSGGPGQSALGIINTLLQTPRAPPPGIGPGPAAGAQPQTVGGGIAGVASTFAGPSIKTYGGKNDFSEWEFVFQLQQGGVPGGGIPSGANPQGQNGQLGSPTIPGQAPSPR
jgi:hypothetical protein